MAYHQGREDLDEREVGGWEDATIHVLAHVAHYASSVFEGIRCYKTNRGPRSSASMSISTA
jgi:branched-subunit amino acid aminotransferase/4-amino-4-deoxychorismate lyase